MTRSVSSWGFSLSIFAVFMLALGFRLPRLHERPMHVDEAVQAFKTGILLDENQYRYDPDEYHGPTLHYIARFMLRLCGVKTFADTTETQFRMIPAIFGSLLILLFLAIGDALGRPATIFAALLTAVSPAMVFYSRYYIHETLLVFFTFAMLVCAWQHTRMEKTGWAILAGLSVGLIYATKETCVLTFFAIFLSLGFMEGWTHLMDQRRLNIHQDLSSRHHFFPLILGCMAAALLFSAFLTDPHGPFHSITTHLVSLRRAGPGGIHEHPWHYYLKMLLWTRHGRGPWFSEALILGLALLGILRILTRHSSEDGPILFQRFLAFYAITLTLIYSMIPYKTPWCMLSFLQATILLAGIGAWALILWMRKWPLQILMTLLLLAGIGHLAQVSNRTNFKYYVDRRNPYVYAHTQLGFLKLAQRMEDLAHVDPQGRHILIKIISPDYWPLPWYLRKFDRVGYWNNPGEHPQDQSLDAPIIITSPDLIEEILAQIQGEYQIDSYYPLWPDVFVIPCIDKDLWNTFMATRM